MAFKNPYTQVVLDTWDKVKNVDSIYFDYKKAISLHVKGANNLNKTWGAWEFRCEVEEGINYYTLYNEAAMYEILLNDVNSTAEILDWVIHMAGKNEYSMGVGSTHFLGCAFREILTHSGINPRSNAVFDGIDVARKYWQSLRVKRQVSARVRHSILERDGFKCCDCGASVATGAVLEVDHTIPISKGGSNDASNLRTLCSDCNRGKSDRIVDYTPVSRHV